MGDLAVLFAATLAAGFLRGVTGFGFALAAVPFFSLSIEPVYAVILAQILQITAAPVDVYQHHRKLDREALGLLCFGALIFTPIGALFAMQLPPDLMRLTIAVVVMFGLFALIFKVQIRDGKAPAVTAGALSGLLAGLAAMPGPPAVAYFLGRGVDKSSSRASLLVFFAFTAVVAIGTAALGSDDLRWDMFLYGAACYPALLVGSALGGKVFQRLGDGHYRIGAIAVLFVSALITGAKGFSGLFQ